MTKKMIKDIINPIDGIFDKMPDDIWAGIIDSQDLDIELYAKLGEMYASPLLRYFDKEEGADIEGLAAHIYRKHARSWTMFKTALYEEYNMFLTSRFHETIENTTSESITGSHQEEVDNTGTQAHEIADNHQHTKTGSIENHRANTDTYDRSDVNTIDRTNTKGITGTDEHDTTYNITDKLTASGVDKEKTTYNTTETGSDELTKSGSENTSGSDNRTKDLTTTDTGNTDIVNTGTQKNAHSEQVYGFGGSGAVDSRKTDDTRTDNLQEKTTNSNTNKETGTDNLSKNETLTFTNRKDKTASTQSKTGNDELTTTHGKVDTGLKTGTESLINTKDLSETTQDEGSETVKQTGTVGQIGEDITSYTDYEETDITSGTDTRTDNMKEVRDGTNTQERILSNIQQTDREADSPLSTTQSLVIEEIEVRMRYNLVDLILETVRKDLALQTWRPWNE